MNKWGNSVYIHCSSTSTTNIHIYISDIDRYIGFAVAVPESCPNFVTPWMQHTRLPCPSPSPRACLNWCPSSQWCHPTISSSVIHFSSCLQPLPASGSFLMSQFFTSGGQSIGASASACPSNEYSGLNSFKMGWLDLLAVPGALKSLLQHHSSKDLHQVTQFPLL